MTRMQPGCEFCVELSGQQSRFAKIYGGHANRKIATFGKLVALPTIGQLFKGSLLLMPTYHVESFAAGMDEFQKDLLTAIEQLTARLRVFGSVICFEHGAKRQTGAGCGIYHAHFHLVPVPQPIGASLFTTNYSFFPSDLISGLRQLRQSANYFIVQDSDGKVACLDETDAQGILTSQFARRALAANFHLGNHWDWREYQEPEPWLAETMRLFGESHVSDCCRD